MSPRAFWAQRPLVCLALAYGAGILLGSLAMGLSPFVPLTGILLGGLALVLCRKAQVLRAAACLIVFLFLGVLLGGLAAHPKLPAEGSYFVEGRVSGQSEYSEDGRRVKSLLSDVKLRDGAGAVLTLHRAYWTYYPEPGSALPLDGQKAMFTGQLYHPSGRANPYGFDFRAYLLQRGITAGISGARGLAFDPAAQTQPASPWLRARSAIAARLDLIFGPQHGALAKALLIGVRDGLDENLTADFRQAGIAHILAVSGLHVSFMVGGLMLVLRRFSLSPRALLIILSLLLMAYCRLLDFSPSIVRASVLSVLLLLGRALRRRVDPLTSLAAAFLLILLFRPLDLFNLGFQLSFLAVFGILTLGDAFNARLSKRPGFARLHPILQKLIQAHLITLAASLLTLVPLANAFHQFSLAGLLISPLAIAAIGLVMGLFAVGLLLSFISLPLAMLAAWPAKLLSGGYQAAVSAFAHLPLASIRLAAIPPIWFIPYHGALWLMTRYTAVRKAPRLALLGALAVLLAALPLLEKPAPLQYIQLSTGNSDSAVILDGPVTFVVDAGEHGGDLASLLLSKGRVVDHLIITHLHQDHAGGLLQLLDAGIPIREILLPYGALEAQVAGELRSLLNQAQAAGIPIHTLGRGDVLQSGKARGEVLWPIRGALYPGMNPNRGSLVIYWDLNGTSLLGTGDLHADYAARVYRPAQVMKLPHHGARADNSWAALALVSPQLGLITASDKRADRHQGALETLVKMDALQAVTGQTGAITLSFHSADEVTLTQYLPGGSSGLPGVL